MTRILSILEYLLLIVSAVIILVFYFGPTMQVGAEEVPRITETALYWTYALLGVAALSTIVFSLVKIFQQPKNAKVSFISIGVMAIVVLIAYSLASDSVLSLTGYEGEFNTPTALQWSGTGLITMYVFLGMAVLAILYTEIAGYFKK